MKTNINLDLSKKYLELAILIKNLLEDLGFNNTEDEKKLFNVLNDIDNFFLVSKIIPQDFIMLKLHQLLLKVFYQDLLTTRLALENSLETSSQTNISRIIYKEAKNIIKANNFIEDSSPFFKIIESENIDRPLIISFLKTTTLPNRYLCEEEDRYGGIRVQARNVGQASNTEKQPSPLVKVIVKIDGEPLVSTKRLDPNKTYSLNLEIFGIHWPKDFTDLHLDFYSTLPSDQYSISNYSMTKPVIDDKDKFSFIIRGYLKFSSSQSELSEQIFLSLRAYFKNEVKTLATSIIGTNEITFKVTNHKILSSGFTTLDQHILDLISKIPNSPSMNEEINKLIPLLNALIKLLGTYAQTAIFKEATNIQEKEFHANVYRDLKLILGEDVHSAGRLAGGILDLRYKERIIELKVERSDANRLTMAQSYSQQSTQYQAVEGQQISILLVLDVTEKINPPGDIRNDVLIVDVPTHGGADQEKQYPSKTFLFCVNGNIKSPSFYSR